MYPKKFFTKYLLPHFNITASCVKDFKKPFLDTFKISFYFKVKLLGLLQYYYFLMSSENS